MLLLKTEVQESNPKYEDIITLQNVLVPVDTV